VFERPDSTWANQYRTDFADLERGWIARAALLPPYITFDLSTAVHHSVPADEYRPAAAAMLTARTGARSAAESEARIAPDDVTRLARRLNRWRWFWRLLFARGFSFRLGEHRLFYCPRTGRLGDTAAGERGDFEIAVPALTIGGAAERPSV
jgi:hypothetical protein